MRKMPTDKQVDWIESLEEVVVEDTEGNETQFGGHVYADGDIEAGGDVVCGRDLIVDHIQNIQDPDGVPLFTLPPAENGEYVLHAIVNNGTVTYIWIAAN